MKKVILDTDMVEGFDDGIALIMLENAKNIELLGVTTVCGNTNIQKANATAIKQIELLNLDTPIYEGSSQLLNDTRSSIDFIRKEENYVGKIYYSGFLSNYINNNNVDKSLSYEDYYFQLYNEKCTYNNIYTKKKRDIDGCDNAVDYLINQVNKYPNEITLLAIGPLTNIARAIIKDPSFSSKVKEIVYMGGAFYVDGNSTKNAEFNWWVDPDAAKICLNSNWGLKNNDYNNQIIFSLKSSINTEKMPQNIYDKILAKTYNDLKKILIKTSGIKSPTNLWDVIAGAYVIDPNIVLSWNNENYNQNIDRKGVYVDIENQLNSNFAKAFVTKKKVRANSKKAIIANKIDSNLLFKDIIYPLLTK